MGMLGNKHRRHLALTALVAAGLAAYLTGSVRSVLGFDLALVLALVGGFPIFCAAVAGLARLRISADLAVSLAAVAALAIGQYAVAAEVMLIMLIGEALENFAVERTRSGIEALLALRPQVARVRRGERELVVPVEDIQASDVVIVRPGDQIPVDGTVAAGSSSVDQSPITGESLPADKLVGDEVFAGTINLHGALELAVERVGEDTTIERIIRLVEEAEEAKAPTERLADKYATYFVPVVLVAAGVTFWITRDVIRSVAVLVVACPCALVLATPTAIAAGIGALVRRGILVKGGVVLERLGRLRAVLFDKTGTLTRAQLRIAKVAPVQGWDEDTVLRIAASVERPSEHPVAQLIVQEAEARHLSLIQATEFAAHPGQGASAVLEDTVARVGSAGFVESADLTVPPALQAEMAELAAAGCTLALVAAGEEVVGAVAMQDTLRDESKAAIDALRGLGIERIVMLTGDNPEAARTVAGELDIDDVRAGLLPGDKVQAVREAQEQGAPVAMVGDGINDAPSLVTADVGVAMADIGTDVAIASADLVLVGDDLSKLPDAVACGRRVLRTIWVNVLGFALAFNLVAVAVAAAGWLSPVAAAVVHQVSSLIVVLNSLRLLVDTARWRERAAKVWAGVRRPPREVAIGAGAAAVLAYLCSGLYVVRIGEVGVEQRFGRVTRADAGPGLHYRWPYPFGRHWSVKAGRIRRVEVGFRTAPGSTAEPPAYEWNVQHRGGRYLRQPAEAEVLAGDEKLIDVTLVVHYRVSDPTAALFTIGERQPDGASKWDVLVRDVTEACLHSALARRPVDAPLADRREEVAEAIRQRIEDALGRCSSGLAVVGLYLGDVHPPLEVVPSFREVASAREEKEARINEAEAYLNETEALARGEAQERIEKALAFQADRVHRAQGGADRFTPVAEAQRDAPELTHLRLRLQTIEQTLAGRRKIILDHAHPGTRRLLYLGREGLWRAPPAPSPKPLETEGPVVE